MSTLRHSLLLGTGAAVTAFLTLEHEALQAISSDLVSNIECVGCPLSTSFVINIECIQPSEAKSFRPVPASGGRFYDLPWGSAGARRT